MKCLVVLSLFVALACGDVSHLGYNYPVPHTSYGSPVSTPAITGYTHGVNSGVSQGVNSGFTHGVNSGYINGISQEPHTGFSSGSGSGVLTTGLGSGVSYDSGSTGINYQLLGLGSQGLSSGFQGGFDSTKYQVASNTGFSNGYQGQIASTNTYQTANDFQYVQHQQPQQVFKHVYVHSAPEELQVRQTQPAPILPPPQKHYKIIFIKAPAPALPSVPVVPVQPQNEEKTIVYVLSKTPEEQRPVVVPQVLPTPPSKPEVYFIKYDAKKESAGGLQNTINEYVNSHPGLLGSQESITSSVINTVGAVDTGFGPSVTTVAPYLEQVSGDSGVSGVSVNTVSSSGTFGSSVATNEIEGTSHNNVQGDIVGLTQGLPHATYGTPNFRS